MECRYLNYEGYLGYRSTIDGRNSSQVSGVSNNALKFLKVIQFPFFKLRPDFFYREISYFIHETKYILSY